MPRSDGSVSPYSELDDDITILNPTGQTSVELGEGDHDRPTRVAFPPTPSPKSHFSKTSMLRPPSSLPIKDTLLLLTTVLPEIMIHHMLTPLYPYMTRSLLPPEQSTKTGYYAGLLQSAYAFPTTFMDAVWGHLSDGLGRPQILLGGLVGYGAGTLLLGLSTAYWMAVVSLGLTGFFSSNSVVAKGMIGDIAHDEESRAWAYSAYGVVFSAAGIAGTLAGGFLADPALFNGIEFLRNRPYFVACSIGTMMAALGVLVTIRFVRHSRNRDPYSALENIEDANGRSEDLVDVEMVRVDPRRRNSDDSLRSPTESKSHTFLYARLPRFLHSYIPLLTLSTLIPILLYTIHKLTHTVFHTSLPLLASASTSHGGFGLPPKSTSLAMSMLSLSKLVLKASYYPIHRILGTRWCYVLGSGMIVPAVLIPPLFGRDPGYMWPAIYTSAVLVGAGEGLVYLSSIMLITRSVERRRFGLVHGLAGCVGSFMKTVGPAVAGWVWEIGVEAGNGWWVFGVCAGVAGVGGIVGWVGGKGKSNTGIDVVEDEDDEDD